MLNLGKIGLDIVVNGNELKKLDNQIDATGRKFEGLGKKVGKILGGLAIGKAIKDLSMAAIDAYANFQQLEGGVETLFGNASETVLANAKKAYSEAGVSANEYLEQATSFSAALISGLGGDQQKAAEITNQAIIDMSDNANKMGTDIALIQHAYQGFSRGTFAMLDNLKLGYGGTRNEMQRLLKDASEISGIKYDINNLADIMEGIHVIQDNLGISGTTLDEASTTITGSLNQMKSAWQDLLAVVGNPETSNAQLEEAANNFVETVKIFLSNIVPVIVDLAPDIIKAAGEIIHALGDALNEEGNKEAIKEAFGNLLSDSLKMAIEEFPVASIIAGAGLAAKIAGAFKGMSLFGGGAAGAGGAAGGGAGGGGGLLAGLGPAIAGVTALSAAIGGLTAAGVKMEQAWQSKGWKHLKDLDYSGVKASKTVRELKKDVDSLPKEAQVILNSKDNATSKIEQLMAMLDKLPTEKRISVYTTYMEQHKNLSDNFSPSGGHRIGLNEVPFDGYRAELHKGETILTAAEANQYQKYLDMLEAGSSNSGVVISVSNNTFSNRSDVDYLVTEIQKKITRQLGR